MTSDKYEKMIIASGGFTKTVKRGDRPQPLTKEDEVALTNAWHKIQISETGYAGKKRNKKGQIEPSKVRS